MLIAAHRHGRWDPYPHGLSLVLVATQTALSYEIDRQVEGTVEADDLYHTAGQQGQARQGRQEALGRRPWSRRKKREPGRAIMTKTGRRLCVGQPQGAVVVHATRDFTVKTVQKAANVAVHAAVGSTPTRPAAIGP